MKHKFKTFQTTLFQIVLLVIAFIVFASRTSSQVQMTVTHVPVDQLAIGDIDVEHFSNQNEFFKITITTDTIGGSPLSQMVSLKFSTDIQLSDAYYENAVSFATNPFLVSGKKEFSNREIGRNSSIQTKPGSFEYSSEARNKIQNVALSTGKMPAGTYTIKLDLADSTDNIVASTSFNIVLRNLTRVNLLSPQDNSESTTLFPFFQWSFEGDSVEVSVYEKLPYQTSNEEAAQGIPHLVRHSGDVDLPFGARTFQYPSQNVRSLEEGKTYVWKVRGFSQSLGGTNDVNSEIWSFNIPSQQNRATSGNDSTLITSSQQAMDLLQLFSDLSPELLALLQSGNLQPTGVFVVDGVTITAEELRQILSMLHTNPDKIVGITIVE